MFIARTVPCEDRYRNPKSGLSDGSSPKLTGSLVEETVVLSTHAQWCLLAVEKERT